MKELIEIHIIGASEIIFKWILLLFSKKLFIEKKEILFILWKGNKMKGGNKVASQSGRDRYTVKNYVTIWIFSLIPFFFNVINGLF